MSSIFSDIPEGVLKVLSRSVGDPFGIAENAIEGAVTGAAIGAIAHRMADHGAKTDQKKAIKEGAQMGLFHGAVGKVLSRIPGEAARYKVTNATPIRRALFAGDTPGTQVLADMLSKDVNRSVGYLNKGMAKAEKVVRNVYTYNRVKTAIKERMKHKDSIKKIHHTIGDKQ